MRLFPTMFALLIGASLAGAAPAVAQTQQSPSASGQVSVAPGTAKASETAKASATVVGIDANTREITLRRQDGKVVTVTAGEDVRNFDQLAVGDRVNVEYTRSLALDLKKGGSAKAGRSEKAQVSRAPAGAKPGGTATREVTILANVVAVDRKNQLVTLRGPEGNTVDLNVQDPAQLKNIKKGDQVQAVYTESLAIAVEPQGSASSGK